MGLILQDTARFDMYIHTLLLYMAIDSVAYHVSQFVAASLHGLVHTFPLSTKANNPLGLTLPDSARFNLYIHNYAIAAWL